MLPGVAGNVVSDGIRGITPGTVRVLSVVMHVTAKDEHQTAGDKDAGVKKSGRRRGRQYLPLAILGMIGVEFIRQYLSALRLGHVPTVHVYKMRQRIVRRTMTVAPFNGVTNRLDDLPLPRSQVILLDGVQVTILRRITKDHNHFLFLPVTLDEIRRMPSYLYDITTHVIISSKKKKREERRKKKINKKLSPKDDFCTLSGPHIVLLRQ